MGDYNLKTSGNETWLTPPELVKSLGEFDLDPCMAVGQPWELATSNYTLPTDGLAQPWAGRVWCNPPYGNKTFAWLDKLSTHPGGGIGLVFARTETIGFHRYVWDRAHAVFFFKGRISFLMVDGKSSKSAPAPSCLIAYTARDTSALLHCGLKGRFVRL